MERWYNRRNAFPMTMPLLRSLIPLTTIICLLLTAAACGDDDDDAPLTEEEYFTQLETILGEFAETSNTLRAENPQAFTELDATQEYYTELLVAMGEAFDEVEQLQAPTELSATHPVFVMATQQFQTEVERVSGEVAELEDDLALAEYADDLRNDPALTQATTAVNDACNDLQSIADSASVEVDLLCGEASDPVEDLLLEQYFAAVERIFAEADTNTAAAEQTLNERIPESSFEEQKVAIDSYLTSVTEIFTNTINQLRSLGAPEPVAEPQADFIDAVEEMIETAAAFQENLQGTADGAVLDERRTDFGEEIGMEVERANDACGDMQAIAEGRAIDVDLACD